MKKNSISQQIINFIKKHPIRILVSGTGGVSLFWGMYKIIDLDHTNILQMLSNIKDMLLNNIAIVMICVCVIVIATYIFIFKIRKLKVDESTNQEILKAFKDIASENANVNDIEIHKNNEELSLLMNIQHEKDSSHPPNNLYTLKGRKKGTDTSKEIKSN